MSTSQLVALATSNQHPYGGRSLDELRHMDDWQIMNVVMRPGDKKLAEKGVYWPVAHAFPFDEDRGGADFADMFDAVWLKRGVSMEELEERRQEYLILNPGAF